VQLVSNIVAVAVMAGIAGWLIAALITSIRKERRSSNLRRIWANFALSIGFCILFLTSWAAQGVAQWDQFRSEQAAHGEPVRVQEFISDFAQSTLENWQSEFLQLFSFVVMSALFLHRGSAESKDSDDRIEAAVNRIEKRLEEIAPTTS
jgi:hypothetical protein